MTREAQLEYCTLCLNRKFSLKEGVICALTEVRADFDDTCPSYSEDADAVKRKKELAELRLAREQESETAGLSKYGIKNQLVAGLIVFLAGLMWLVVGLVGLNLLFFFPMFMIAIGLVIIALGLRKEVAKKRAMLENERRSEILDATDMSE